MKRPAFNLHGLGLTGLLALGTLLGACTAVPRGTDCAADALIGQWTAHIEGQTQGWTLTLEPHPEHLGSLRGTLSQGTLSYLVVADVDEGEFTLEESHDGQRIAATWQGRAAGPQCAQRVQGHRVMGEQPRHGFNLVRQP